RRTPGEAGGEACGKGQGGERTGRGGRRSPEQLGEEPARGGAGGGAGERPLRQPPPSPGRVLLRRVWPPLQQLLPEARALAAPGDKDRPWAAAGDAGAPGPSPPPSAPGAGMELFQAKDHYILQQGERALWCSRRDGSLQLRPATDLLLAWNPICLGLVEGVIGKIQLHSGGAARAAPKVTFHGTYKYKLLAGECMTQCWYGHVWLLRKEVVRKQKETVPGPPLPSSVTLTENCSPLVVHLHPGSWSFPSAFPSRLPFLCPLSWCFSPPLPVPHETLAVATHQLGRWEACSWEMLELMRLQVRFSGCRGDLGAEWPLCSLCSLQPVPSLYASDFPITSLSPNLISCLLGADGSTSLLGAVPELDMGILSSMGPPGAVDLGEEKRVVCSQECSLLLGQAKGDLPWWLILIRQKALVGKLPGDHMVCKITKIAVLSLSEMEPQDLELEVPGNALGRAASHSSWKERDSGFHFQPRPWFWLASPYSSEVRLAGRLLQE
ncbi:hypothetical protein MC885_012583, partial [Smutsia gigantea]